VLVLVLVLVLDDDVSPWWWTAVGFAFVFGMAALVATVAAVLRRRAAIEGAGSPPEATPASRRLRGMPWSSLQRRLAG
jgi:hypothetical protein